MANKERVAASFLNSVLSYDEHAVVQKEVAQKLLELLGEKEGLVTDRVLELGCGTGIFTNCFSAKYFLSELYINDLVPELCHVAKTRAQAGRVEVVAGDAEKVELPGNLDLIVSASSLQWFTDLPRFWKKAAGKLTGSGVLACAFYGEGTMAELSTLTGGGLPYAPLAQVEADLLATFSNVSVQKMTKTLYFSSLIDVLHHIKNTGVGGSSDTPMSFATVKKLEREYIARFGTSKGLPVSYESYFVIAEK